MQAFCHIATYLRIKEFWARLCNSELTEYMATIYDFIDPICAIRVKKVSPVSHYRPEMVTHIRQAICALGEVSLCHGDIRLDNIGYDGELDRYVLYDYDGVKVGADMSAIWRDLDRLRGFAHLLAPRAGGGSPTP